MSRNLIIFALVCTFAVAVLVFEISTIILLIYTDYLTPSFNNSPNQLNISAMELTAKTVVLASMESANAQPGGSERNAQ